MKPQILLLGAGGHAHSCLDVIEQESRFIAAGLIDPSEKIGGTKFGLPILGDDSNLPELASGIHYALVCVGQIKSPEIRIEKHTLLKQIGFKLPTIVSPQAYVSKRASIGAGSIVMPGAIVNAGAVVGENCIINSRALLEHDVVVEDHTHVSTGAIVNGASYIGQGSFIGSGSLLREGVSIPNFTFIAMGQIVKNSVAQEHILERIEVPE